MTFTIFGSPPRGNFKKWLSLEFSDGHELCGEVIKIGKKVTKFKIGDRVVSEAVYHCKNETVKNKTSNLPKSKRSSLARSWRIFRSVVYKKTLHIKFQKIYPQILQH